MNQVSEKPVFDFCEFFTGNTSVKGYFADRFGKTRKRFTGEFNGYFDKAVFVLDEHLDYSDGIRENRVWRITIDDAGRFVGRSDSLIGEALGTVSGNSLHMNYRMRIQVGKDKSWNLAMDDWMFLQPDRVLRNTTHLKKWGVTIGTVTSNYEKRECASTELASTETPTNSAAALRHKLQSQIPT